VTPDDLVEIEAIKQLKARYFRYMDTKRFQDWANLFTEDAVLDNQHARPQPLVGRAQIAAVVSAGLTGVVTVHHGHMPEIRIISPTQAWGTWAMEDYLVPDDPAARLGHSYHGFGHYYESYRKVDGVWRIAQLRLTRLRVEQLLAPPVGAAASSAGNDFTNVEPQ